VHSDLTPAAIIATLSQIGREIDEATAELERADKEAVIAKADYRLARAKALISAEGSVAIKEATAEIECYTVYLAAEVAEQQQRAVVSKIRALRDRLEIGRSLGPLVRLEWGQA
jgi:hypothetical protein